MEPGPVPVRRTRAVVIVYKGRIVAEQYAPGFYRDTPMPGWSMTGAMTNALAGILVKQGRLSTDQCNLLLEWRGHGDLRSKITVDNLMRMSSGLQFDEDYSDPQNDLSYMLFRTGNAAAYAVGKRLEYKPGTMWHFSSGSLVILSRIFKDAIHGTEDDYLTFPQRALFRPLGMSTAVIEPDAAGTFLASSFGYASARDWARLGLLFMRDGVWNGRRIFPKGWIRYSTTPTPGSPHSKYGACFWLCIPDSYTSPVSRGLALPDDCFYAVGQNGQFIVIIPSKKLVIVRLGLTRKSYVWDQRLFTADIVDAISSD
jgi:CubicO group peptidase (beta-lactamase class C family)